MLFLCLLFMRTHRPQHRLAGSPVVQRGPRERLTTSHDQLGRHVRDSIPAGWCWVVELSTADHTDTGLYVPLFGRLGLGVPIVVPTTKRRLQASLTEGLVGREQFSSTDA